jgi:chemotaxis receptor (MCP) glutamine deamidase CheD
MGTWIKLLIRDLVPRILCPICQCTREEIAYVECSLHAMIDRFKKFGISLNELESRIYGGADMFGTPLTIFPSSS